MQALDPSEQLNPGWTKRFWPLKDVDVRGPGCESYEKSEGRFQPSWIWLIPRLANDTMDGNSAQKESSDCPASDTADDNSTQKESSESSSTANPDPSPEELQVAESMRVHWAKCQARADCYEEEVILTVEEMGHTLRYFKWKKTWWLSLQSKREKSSNPPPTGVQQGLHAYTYHQAYIYEMLIISYANRWQHLLTIHGLGWSWLRCYPVAADPLSARPSHGQRQPKAKLNPTSVGNPSTQMDCSPLKTPLDTDADVDSPMEDSQESEDDSDYVFDEEEDYDFD